MEAEFRRGVGSISVGFNSSLQKLSATTYNTALGEVPDWILGPNWDLTMKRDSNYR